MVVTDYNEQFLDKRGTDHLIDELKAYIDGIATGNIDLSNYVTKEELQAKLDALDINIDLSSYATKEELTQAINSIDLSAYALKTEIPSLEGYATTEYVDNAVSNIPATDLSNYYTKDETYNKTEVDIKVAEAGGSSVPILSMKDWIELNTQYNENVDFKNKKIYFDTSIAFKNLLKDKTYSFYLYNGDGASMNYHNYVVYENGILKFINANETKVDLDGQSGTGITFKTSYLYDKTQSNGKWTSGSLYGKWINGWKSLSEDFIENTEVNNVSLCGNVFRLGNGISSPNFGYKDMESDSYDIDGKELYHALLKSIIKIVDENGNEIAFKTVPTKEDYLEYVNNLSGGSGADMSNYYTKDEVYTKAETDALIPTVTNGKDGVSPTVSITETDNCHTVSITDKNGTQSFDVTNGSNGKDGVSPTVTVTKEGKVATITCTDVNGTTTATISDGADGSSSGGGSSSGSGEVYSTDEIAIGKWIDGRTIYRKVISMDLPSVQSGQTHSAVAVVGNANTPCNIMMLDWRAVSYAGLTGSNYDYPSKIIHGDGFKSAVVWTTKRNISALTEELCKDMLSVFHSGDPKTSYINCYYGSSFASRRCDFIIDYLKVETA